MTAWESFRSTFYDIGRDLLSLEINTIEKPNLTARKMPVLPHALLDIAEQYRDFLTKRLDLDSYWRLSGSQREEWRPSWRMRPEPLDRIGLQLTTGTETFDKLRWAAARALACDPAEERIKGPQRVILMRIRRNCDQLKKMIQDLREDAAWSDLLDERTRRDLLEVSLRRKLRGRLPVDYAIMLRKIWDIGVESVYLQTVVQLDGDVLTRIQEDIAENKRAFLLQAHEQSMQVSLKYWETLFNIVKDIAGSVTGLFHSKSSLGK